MTITESPARRNRRPRQRELFCPAHPEQLIQGNGKKYYLHLLQPEQLQKRGISAKKAQMTLYANSVLVLSNKWLEKSISDHAVLQSRKDVPSHAG